ncbi:Ca-dependent carbohydrate-binding module xylan-binding [Nannocystis exedens]|uniref:Ca-dependent carbohydrate-binding module xylan-binding n=1 Tax=Nannocystis exedens TaxID=54 RepID=A0A1I1W4Z7_9BACT|nr:DUF1592 domain-containing protein [Nannocystis exedens]PCC67455.1 hypothetical protein NAEX_00461 [Nannocystis exedens]SFD90194.1 Ca-dependent carbohydrate-binding module xylan-binding [Nannocystis exedens]
MTRQTHRPWFGAALGLVWLAACPGSPTANDTDEPATAGNTMTSPTGGPTEGTAGETDDPTAGDPTEGGDEADPGRVTVHRLNRTEYNNTVKDLLGTAQRPADSFPADDFGLGFDNISDVLSTSPLQAELYERAAEGLILEAMEIPITDPGTWQIEAEDALASGGGAAGDAWNLNINGEVYQTIELPYDGQYKFSARVWGQQAGPDLPHMNLTVDGAPVAMFDVEAVKNGAQVYEITIDATAGVHKFAVEFTNDYYDEPNMADRNLLVDWFKVEGPIDLPDGDNPLRTRIMVCDPNVDGEEVCLREILTKFTERAWRRPVTGAELDALMKFIADAKGAGDTWESGLRVALQAVLVSPYFIYRVELDPAPTDLTPHPLSDYELASRLSYFLWSSMPDDELFAAAAAGTLQDPEVLETQARRMLADDRARALIDNFAGQWWLIRNIAVAFKDVALFPQWNDAMRESMRTEMRLFAEAFFSEDRDMLEMLTATDTFVDATLAQHYGIEGQFGAEFTPVDFGELPFQGILNKAGLMTVLSHADHTSPVKRGKWVLESLLCQVPPPPPPGVDTKLNPVEGKTQREILEAHREKPECISCHVTMDPLGFGLEHYDPLGAWRDLDNGLPIDASGTLPNGKPFADGLEMQTLIAAEPDFLRCVARKTFIYALGRAVGLKDIPYLDDVTETFSANDRRFSDLVVSLVTSEPFRMRRGDPAM